jgi:hypothetical protein
VGHAEHEVRWFTPADISTAPDVSEDSRTLAARLLSLAAPQSGPSFQWPPETGRGSQAGRQAGGTAEAHVARTASDPAQSPRLIVIRGNSASGKSEAAAMIREKYGRGLAIVGQDNLRRVVLREHDKPGGSNIGLIDLTARFALSSGYHTVVEGIFNASHYGPMLTALISDHPGRAFAYFLDVPFPETLRWPATKTGTLKYGEAELRQWYRGLDLLPGGIEHVIPARSVTSTRTVPVQAVTVTMTVSPGRPELLCRTLLPKSSLASRTASSPQGCPGPSTAPTNARTTRARSPRPATFTLSRTIVPAISAPAFPSARKHRKSERTHGNARSPQPLTSSRYLSPVR